MADLPPIVIPDELLGRVDPAVTQNAASWALQFGRADTNLVQRAKHESDLSDYAKALIASRQAAEAAHLEKSAGARAIKFHADLLDHQAAVARAKAGIDDANQQRLNELQPLKVQALQAKASADAAMEKRRIQEEALKNVAAEHENNFFADRASFLTANPAATQEAIDANDISLNSRYPHAMKSGAAKEIIGAATRGSLARQREAEKAAAIVNQNTQSADAAAALGMKPHGIGVGGAVTYEAPKTAVADAEKRLTHLENLRMKKGMNEDVNKDIRAYLDAEIEKIKKPAEVSAKVPSAGEVRSGYKFLGGNPAEQKNWQKEP